MSYIEIDKELKFKCYRCLKLYDPNLNNNLLCRYHPGVLQSNIILTADGIRKSRYTCCNLPFLYYIHILNLFILDQVKICQVVNLHHILNLLFVLYYD